MKNPIVSKLTIFSLATALVSTACAPGSEPLVTSDSSATAQEAALAADPDYARLLRRTSTIVATTANHIYFATAEQRQLLRARLALLQSEGSGPEIQAFPAIITGVTGLTEADFNQLHAEAQELAARYPSIDLSPAFLGQSSDQLQIRMEYELRAIEPCEGDSCDCLQECEAEYRSSLNASGFDWVGTLWSLNLYKVLKGTVDMIGEQATINDALDDCRELCTGLPQDECEDDGDCPSNKYCTHPLGNPYWSCRTKKELGNVCSRHGKCASNCCKYHLPSNLVSKVCRPADRCN